MIRNPCDHPDNWEPECYYVPEHFCEDCRENSLVMDQIVHFVEGMIMTDDESVKDFCLDNLCAWLKIDRSKIEGAKK